MADLVGALNIWESELGNLYIVESPFQLLGALEAQGYYGGYSVLIVKYGIESGTNSQIRSMLEYGRWGKVLEIGQNQSGLMARLQLYRLLIEMRWRKIIWQRVFLGEVRVWALMRIVDVLGPNEVYILDDGNVTLALHAEMAPVKGAREGAIRRLMSTRAALLDLLIGALLRPFATGVTNNYGFFTCYDLDSIYPKQIIIRHQFQRLKTLKTFCDINDAEVMFFGAPLSELGVIERTVELACLALIGKYYCARGLRVTYVSHRRESDEKLKQIADVLKLDVVRFNVPVEVVILTRQYIPSRVASFYSTALYTVSQLVRLEGADAFELEAATIEGRYREEVREAYDAYRKIMNIIPLYAIR